MISVPLLSKTVNQIQVQGILNYYSGYNLLKMEEKVINLTPGGKW